MKNLEIIGLLFVLTGITAHAKDTKFSCANVGGTEEWTIRVDLTKKKAGFYDNDSKVIVPLKTQKLGETEPPQWMYYFEGVDKNSTRKNDVLGIDFNETRLTASVTLHVGEKDEKTLEAQDGCVVSKKGLF